MSRLKIEICRVKKMNYKVIDKETYYRKRRTKHYEEGVLLLKVSVHW